MERQPVESSSIAAVGYDGALRTLEVEFVNGGVYAYDGVPKAVYAAFLAADSHGRFFNAEIRDGYPFHRLRAARR